MPDKPRKVEMTQPTFAPQLPQQPAQPTAPQQPQQPQQPAAPQQPVAPQQPQQPATPPNPLQLATAGPQKPGDPAPQQTGQPQQPNDPNAQQPASTGLQADLVKERERRQSLEKSVADALGIEFKDDGSQSHYEQITARLTPLAKIATALVPADGAADGQQDPVALLDQRFNQFEQTITQERQARWRTEVAYYKGLTPQQAGRLQGNTLEELAADADELIKTFGVQSQQVPGQQSGAQQQQSQAPGQPGVPSPFAPGQPAPGQPRPDPTQGVLGTGNPIDSRIAEAERNGDVEGSIGLLVDKYFGRQQ